MVQLRNFKINKLYDLKVDLSYRLNYKDMIGPKKISCLNDEMFKTMFVGKHRLKYVSLLLSYILNMSYEEILNKIQIYSVDLPKEKYRQKARRCDLVLKIDDTLIDIEMNNSYESWVLERNIYYASKLYGDKIQKKEDDRYNSVLSININNFSYGSKAITLASIKEENTSLTDKLLFMQINVPKIREIWYTKGEFENDLERFIMVMIEPDEKEAIKIAKGSEIMTDLAYEAIMASEEGRVIGSYDRELAWKEMLLKEGREIGEKFGIDTRNTEIVRNMLKDNVDFQSIIKYTGLNKKDIEKIQQNINNAKIPS